MKKLECKECGYDMQYKMEICPRCGREKPYMNKISLFLENHRIIAVVLGWTIGCFIAGIFLAILGIILTALGL